MRHQGKGWQQNDRPPRGRPAPRLSSPPRPPRRNTAFSFQPLTSETPTGWGRPNVRQRPQRQCREEERRHAGSASGTSRDNPDRSRSTTEDQGRGALTRHGGTAAALPPRRREGHTHTPWPPTEGSKREASAASADPRAGSGPGSAPLPSTGRQETGRRGERPTGRTRRAVPFAMNVRPSPGAALARPRRAQSHHIDQPTEGRGTRGAGDPARTIVNTEPASASPAPHPRESGRRHRRENA